MDPFVHIDTVLTRTTATITIRRVPTAFNNTATSWEQQEFDRFNHRLGNKDGNTANNTNTTDLKPPRRYNLNGDQLMYVRVQQPRDLLSQYIV